MGALEEPVDDTMGCPKVLFRLDGVETEATRSTEYAGNWTIPDPATASR